MNITMNNTATVIATEFERGMSRYDYYRLLDTYDYSRMFPEIQFDEFAKMDLVAYMKNTMGAGNAARFEKKWFVTPELMAKADELKWELFEISYHLS